jgi:hypothetical protein
MLDAVANLIEVQASTGSLCRRAPRAHVWATKLGNAEQCQCRFRIEVLAASTPSSGGGRRRGGSVSELAERPVDVSLD